MQRATLPVNMRSAFSTIRLTSVPSRRLLVFHQPFGFNAILGLIGLAGILMRNTLILVDQIRRMFGALFRAYALDREDHRCPTPTGQGAGLPDSHVNRLRPTAWLGR
jgi:hypothetical protein